MSLEIPHTFTQKTKAKATEVNDNFDAIEAWANSEGLDIPDGSLELDKLESGTQGQIIVVNSSGVPQYRTGAGAVTVSGTGATAINYSQDDQDSDVGLGSGSSLHTLTSLVLGPGTWIVNGKAIVDSLSGTDTLILSLTQEDIQIDRGEASSTAAATIHVGPESVVVASGTDTVAIKAACGFGGVASWGRISAIRVA